MDPVRPADSEALTYTMLREILCLLLTPSASSRLNFRSACWMMAAMLTPIAETVRSRLAEIGPCVPD
jgi:hypothetical protein